MHDFFTYLALIVIVIQINLEWIQAEEYLGPEPRVLKYHGISKITNNALDYGHYEYTKDKNHNKNEKLKTFINKEWTKNFENNLSNLIKSNDPSTPASTLHNYLINITQNDYLGLKNLKIDNLQLLRDHYYSKKPKNQTVKYKNKGDKNIHLDYAKISYLKQLQGMDSDAVKQASEIMMEILDPEAEKEDEANDFEIFLAIIKSIAYYQLQGIKGMIYPKRVKRDDRKNTCYDILGCFKDEGPFDYFDLLPSHPNEIKTKFLLYTRDSRHTEHILDYKNVTTILKSKFNRDRPTKMIIHGFGSSCDRIWVREMKQMFFVIEDVNVICVDWQNGASVPNYVRAASNTRIVGRQVAVLIEELIKHSNATLDNFHLIGFSLGAHVSGYAGERLKNLARITGLDPAGPLFERFPPSVRLDPTDAKFVDVIHTNADSLLWGGLGAYEPMGDVDFYPNGGQDQNGCENLFVGGVSDILWPTNGDGRYLCNHRRAYKYFVESMLPNCKFPAFECESYDKFLQGDCFPCKDDCGYMGYYADKSPKRGKLYLMTRGAKPFCSLQYKVTVHHSRGPPTDAPVSSYGKMEVSFIDLNYNNVSSMTSLTRAHDIEMKAGGRTSGIVVPHMAAENIVAIQIKYTAYQGWITSGSNKWAINQVTIMSSYGDVKSYCYKGTTLVSELIKTLPLLEGDCNPDEENKHASNNTDTNQKDKKPLNNSEANKEESLIKNKTASTISTISTTPTLPSITPTAVTSKMNESTTFSVIYTVPPVENSTQMEEDISQLTNNETFIQMLHEKLVNVSNGISVNNIPNIEVQTELVPPSPNYSEEKWVRWRDAPPPNLETPLPTKDNEPFNVIKAPNLSNSIPFDSEYQHQNRQDKNNPNYSNVKTTSPASNKWDDKTSYIALDNLDGATYFNPQINPVRQNNYRPYPQVHLNGNLYANNGVNPINRITTPSSILRAPTLSINPQHNQNPHYLNRPRPTRPTYSSQQKPNLHELSFDKNEFINTVPYNSLIDGEIPFKERSRSLPHFPSNPVQQIHGTFFGGIPAKVTTHQAMPKFVPDQHKHKLETIVGKGLAPRPVKISPLSQSTTYIFNGKIYRVRDRPLNQNNNTSEKIPSRQQKSFSSEPTYNYQPQNRQNKRIVNILRHRPRFINSQNKNTNTRAPTKAHAHIFNYPASTSVPHREIFWSNPNANNPNVFIESPNSDQVQEQGREIEVHHMTPNLVQIQNQTFNHGIDVTEASNIYKQSNNIINPPQENITLRPFLQLPDLPEELAYYTHETIKKIAYSQILNNDTVNFNKSHDQLMLFPMPPPSSSDSTITKSFTSSESSVENEKNSSLENKFKSTIEQGIQTSTAAPTIFSHIVTNLPTNQNDEIKTKFSPEILSRFINKGSNINNNNQENYNLDRTLVTHNKQIKNHPNQNSTRLGANLYLQMLPPNFGSLPRLETFSLPKKLMAPPILNQQNDDIRKLSRLGHARSMNSNHHIPIPSGRGAIFTPLHFSLGNNRNPRYIPLRSKIIFS